LAISLEVGEHLPDDRAEAYVDSLVSLSDFVLFSAAIPWQLGIGHVNEQWPEYWQALFAERGYRVLDVIRGQIWNDRYVPIWYRQNLLLYVQEDRIGDLRLDSTEPTLPLSWVHPEVFIKRARAARFVLGFRHIMPVSVMRWLRRRVGL
jgi:hypothetical protein